MMNSISNFADILTVRSYDEFNTKFVPTRQPVDKLNNYAKDLNNRFL